jgi:thiamine-phosphate pyrophosphorylase
MGTVARMLDANANRASEAMRVLEDIARFVLDRSDISVGIKACRHDLRSSLRSTDVFWSRDTAGDGGTELSHPSESRREGLRDIAAAAASRCGEAMRVLEETAKIHGTASSLEAIRYRMYDLSAAVLTSLASRAAKQWSLCLVLTVEACRHPWEDFLAEVIAGGTDCVQVREKTMDGGELVDHVRAVIGVARPRGVPVIVNDRVDVAMAADADGVHLGRTDLPVSDARSIVGSGLIIGATAHNLDEAAAAIDAGADYLGIGAMFASQTKPDREPAGVTLLQLVIDRWPPMHHLAIGGITPANIASVRDAGGRGVAVCASICGAENPAESAAALAQPTVVPA